MNTLRMITAVTAFALLASAEALHGQNVVYSHNESATPPSNYYNGYYGIGWNFTPASDIFFTGIQTRFGALSLAIPDNAYGQRDVTVEVHTAINGTLLRSASFATSPDSSVWVGGSFTGITLDAGTTYFIDFLNLWDANGNTLGGKLGLNGLFQAPSGEFSAYAVEFTGPFSVLDPIYGQSDPIIRFAAPATPATVTPEPAALLLLLTGLAGLAGLAGTRRRRGALDAR